MIKLKAATLGVLMAWCWVPSSGAEGSAREHDVQAQIFSLHGKIALKVDYHNKSDYLHCIRTGDLDGTLYLDSMYFESITDIPKYYGRISNLSDEADPTAFWVVPPNNTLTRTYVLSEYYRFKNGLYSVSYAIPVLPCSALHAGYVAMPFPHYLKRDLQKKLSAEQIVKEMLGIFPKWSTEGFVALVDRLSFEVK
jgi:hypothetical protein